MLQLICNIIKNFNSYMVQEKPYMYGKSINTGEEPYIYDFKTKPH